MNLQYDICLLQPQLCSKLAEGTSDFWFALPLVQALLPGLTEAFKILVVPESLFHIVMNILVIIFPCILKIFLTCTVFCNP